LPCFSSLEIFSVKAIFKIFRHWGIFISNDKKHLTRQFFITHVKLLLDKLGLSSDSYNGHSFRIGAATAAHEARLEDYLIQTLNRWSSDCYTYIYSYFTKSKSTGSETARRDRSNYCLNVLYWQHRFPSLQRGGYSCSLCLHLYLAGSILILHISVRISSPLKLQSFYFLW
jgi:hypothetical protein